MSKQGDIHPHWNYVKEFPDNFEASFWDGISCGNLLQLLQYPVAVQYLQDYWKILRKD